MSYTFFQKKNNASSTLNANVLGGDTTCLVASLQSFPASPNFFVTIWNSTTYPDPTNDPNMEIVKVTGISSGNTFTITRAQEGTLARFHSSGSSIAHLITFGQLQEYESQMNTLLGVGTLQSTEFVSLQADYALLNNNSAQQCFGGSGATGKGQLTVLGSTAYFFEANLYLTNGGTTHTTAFGFGGTAMFTSCNYTANLWSANANAIATSVSVIWVNSATATVLDATSTNASTVIMLNGIIRINGAGTIIPQITFSAAPNGTNLMKTDSYFALWAAGSNTVKFSGPWT